MINPVSGTQYAFNKHELFLAIMKSIMKESKLKVELKRESL